MTPSWYIPFSQVVHRPCAHRLIHYPGSVAYRLLCRNQFVNIDLAECADIDAPRCRDCERMLGE